MTHGKTSFTPGTCFTEAARIENVRFEAASGLEREPFRAD
jgi:hypothetical protein